MDSFDSYVIRKLYKETAKHGDKLAKIEKLVNWNAFTPIIQPMYNNKTPSGGRPNTDSVLMVKLLVLQVWYGSSDPELERQAGNRIDFMHFLGFPKKAPDYSTVWRFRERLAETGRDKLVWEELQRQLDAKGLTVRKGVVQDASFITSDPGHARADKPRGEEAKTRRSRDGAWAKKGGKSVFGYKLHMKMDLGHGLIRELEMTPANVHDSRVDLSELGEVVYRDKGYQGVVPRGWDATMKRASRGHPLGIRDKLRNRRISRRRCPGERPFAVIKRVFGSGHVLVTSLMRVRVKMVFACFCFNLVQLGRLSGGLGSVS
jgi:transposase, IS5 family